MIPSALASWPKHDIARFHPLCCQAFENLPFFAGEKIFGEEPAPGIAAKNLLETKRRLQARPEVSAYHRVKPCTSAF